MSELNGQADYLLNQLVDTDPSETLEWQQSLDAALAAAAGGPHHLPAINIWIGQGRRRVG